MLYRKPRPILTYPVKNEEVGADGFVRDKPSRAERAMEAQAKWFSARNIPFDLMDVREAALESIRRSETGDKPATRGSAATGSV